MEELVHYELSQGTARITLDSPHNRNALSSQLQTELRAHLHTAMADEAVRVVVLTGTGSVFCSGADLSEHRSGTVTVGPEVMVDVLTTLWDSAKPVVCRVNGHARAGGIGLVSACDIALAEESVSFGFAEVRIGALPAMISVTCLPRMTRRAALELFLTGENIDAVRAAEVGLINRAVGDGALDEEVARVTGMLRQGGPEALAGVKPMISRVEELPMQAAFEEMSRMSMERFASAEVREGLRARAERRAPSWVSG